MNKKANLKCGVLSPKSNKKAWIKIVESFVAILLITSVLLIVVNQGYFNQRDISLKVYEAELAILREIQLSSNLRGDILNSDVPMVWEDAFFPEEIKNKINNRVPNYLSCKAKICSIDDFCILDEYFGKDIYAQPVTIMANKGEYNPRQLKLFCWVK